MQKYLKKLTPECINHIFGYTYSPQSPLILQEIKEHNIKKELYVLYFQRMKESLELTFYNHRIDSECVLFHAFQDLSSFINDTYIHINENKEKIKNIDKIKKIFNQRPAFYAYSQYGYKIFWTIWKLFSLQEIKNMIHMYDRFLIMCWSLKLTDAPIPYSWMYLDNSKQTLKTDYENIINENIRINRAHETNLEIIM